VEIYENLAAQDKAMADRIMSALSGLPCEFQNRQADVTFPGCAIHFNVPIEWKPLVTSDPMPYSQILYACTKKETGVGGIAVG